MISQSSHSARIARPLLTTALLALLSGPHLFAQMVTPPGRPERPVEETNIYLVTFRPGTPAADRAAVVQASGAALRRTLPAANAVSVAVPGVAALASLRNDPRVLSVVVNRPVTLHASPAQGNGRGGQGSGGGSKPKTPGSLSATAVSSSEISLAWTDASKNEDGFQIERCANSGCSNFSQVAQVQANVTNSNDTGLAAGQLYRYRVLAFNAAGNSQYSNIAEATTNPVPPPPPPPPPPPAAPSNLFVSPISYSRIDLSWSDNSGDEQGFRLERCVGAIADCGEADFVQIAQLSLNTTSYSNIGLQAQTTYSYRLRAFNTSGVSPYSNSAEGTTPEGAPSSQVVPGGVQRIGAEPGALPWTGTGVGVAVVDTGLDFSHPDLGLQPEVIGGNSFNSFGGSCQDFFGHGTHVAGIIAARDNTEDVVGVAPNATLYCVNVFQPDATYGASATDESLIAGLDWILTNANTVAPPIRVVNMSLGRERMPDDGPNHPLYLAVKALYDRGISVVVSAGNDPLMEVAQEVPASYPEVMAVASTTAANGFNGYDEFFGPCVGEQTIKTDTASYFTTDGAFVGGTGVTVSAPGEQQENIFLSEGTCYLDPAGILSTNMGGGTLELYGTSMAAPHVAGVVALMWEKELSLGSTLAPETARTRIRNNVDRLDTAPLDSPIVEYTFDGQREGVLWAPAALGEASPPPQDLPPAVSILGPTNGSSFPAGASIPFEGTANDPEQGNLAASLRWVSSRDGQIGTGQSFSATLSNGSHIITASVEDAGGNVASSSISVTVGSSSSATSVQISFVTYSLQGAGLTSTVNLVNEFGTPVSGAAVSAILMEFLYSGQVWSVSGTTNSFGNVQFTLINAPIGCYLTEVQSVVAQGLTWTGGNPLNYICK